jgi:hypothetical protein
MLTFTLPSELRSFAWREQRWFYDLMFRAMALTLTEFAQDGKHLDGTPGFTAASGAPRATRLHPWTRDKRRGTEAFET